MQRTGRQGEFERGWCGVLVLALTAFTLAGCEKTKEVLGRATLPDLGPRLPVTAKIAFDPSVTAATLNYTDACNSPHEINLGEVLESTLLDASDQTFQAVAFPGSAPLKRPQDYDITVGLTQKGLLIRTDNVYDRLPAELMLEAVAVFRDQSGKILAERPLKTIYRDKLLLEATQHRCEYASIDAFVNNAVVAVAAQFAKEARAVIDPDGRLAGAQRVTGVVVSSVPPAAATGLSFKATLLDENNNGVLEAGERIKVRVDVVNAGTTPMQGVTVRVTGSEALVAQFPSATLPIGALQPGETKGIDFSGTLPPTIAAQTADLEVFIAVGGAAVAPPQRVTAPIRPAQRGAGVTPAPATHEPVDQLPAATPDFRRPNTYLIAVGIGTYRDQRTTGRRYAAQDANLVAGYLQALGGIPTSNIQLLQDRRALRADLEEAVLDWLPPRIVPDSLIIVYFAGQALVTPAGDTYLIPYEGSPEAVTRLYALKDLEAALAKLKCKLTLFIFDGSVTRGVTDKRAALKAPRWSLGGPGIVRLIGNAGAQDGVEPESLRHGLFTYYLLRGLRGEADTNRDGEVAVGELTAYLAKTVPAQILPPLSPTSAVASLALTKTAPSPSAQAR
jgi:hypothetical protein